ncbi:MAG TPA: PAS domain-containing sensor histidine kinase [Nitrolancea sp.]|jgi:PAS domain S-box-containing protein|nr:PAS domain-containing sensor histidine kinase [Nitrolancea sp.]
MNDDDLLHDGLEALYEEAPCGYIFMRADGTLIRVNQTFLRWTGYAREELVSVRRFQDLLTAPGQIFYENQYAPLIHLQGFVKEVSFNLLCRDQELLPVLVNSVQRSDEDGRPLVIASTIFDATDRRAYERELLAERRKAEQLADIVTASHDAIVRMSPAGVVQSWNDGAERWFGYSAQEMVGGQLQTVLPVLAEGEERRRIDADLHAGRPVYLETVGVRADRRPIDVSVGLAPHYGLLGELSDVSAIIRDISERRALERLQHEFLAMATHELRNPITVIKGHAQLLRRRAAYDERFVDIIIDQSDQLRSLVDDLLLASQIEADRLELRLQAIDLVAEVLAVAEQFTVGPTVVEVETPSNPIMISADRQRLRQVFVNLLTNAVKYSPDGGDIVVRVTNHEREARVAVIDQGIGISDDAIPHLFDRFYRVASTASDAPGIGLGLFITQRIVESHNGRIEVVSEPGHGSTFTVVLPLLHNAASSPSRQTAPLSS